MTPLDTFIADRCYQYPGGRVKFCQFLAAFMASLTREQQRQYPRATLLQELSARFPVGRDSANVLHVGNLSLSPPQSYKTEGKRLVLA